MELTCPNCGTQFSVPDGAIGSKGRKVKCSQCEHTWKQMPLDAAGAMDAQAAAVPPPPPSPPAPRQPQPQPQPRGGTPSALPMDMDPDATVSERTVWGGGGDGDGDDRTMLMSRGEARGSYQNRASRPPERLGERPGGGFSNRDLGDDLSGPDIDDLLGQDPEPIPDLFSRPDEPFPPPRKRSWVGFLSSVLLGLVLLGAAAGAAWYWRVAIVQQVPQAEALYDALGIPVEGVGLGLSFRNVTPDRLTQNNRDILSVHGFVVNVSSRPRPVPFISVVLFDGTNAVVQRAAAEPQVEVLAPGETTGFRVVIDSPSAAAAHFDVMFIPRPRTTEGAGGEGAGGEGARGEGARTGGEQ